MSSLQQASMGGGRSESSPIQLIEIPSNDDPIRPPLVSNGQPVDVPVAVDDDVTMTMDSKQLDRSGVGVISEQNNSSLISAKNRLASEVTDTDDSDEEIDDNLEIIVEGEEEEEEEEEMETNAKPQPMSSIVYSNNISCIDTVLSSTSNTTVTVDSATISSGSSNSSSNSSRGTVSGSKGITTDNTNLTSGGNMNRRHSKECARIKQFFTTLQTFANNTSPEVAEQVQELITALINGLATVEEFHQEIQQATNYPLKEFVIVFLKENLKYFQEELKETNEVLSNIFTSKPSNADTLTTASQYVESELLIVPATKPAVAPPTSTTTTVITTPISPLIASSLVSMSAPPATIHEPPVIAPTRIETIPNASAIRKRPRDLVVTDSNDDTSGRSFQQYSGGSSIKRVPRPIPTATLTPTQDPSHSHSSEVRMVHHQIQSSTVAPVISTHHTAVAGSNNHIHYSSRPSSSSSVDTPPLRDPSPSGGPGGSNISYAANQRLINQIKEDWGHLDTMMIAIEGMVAKTQKSLQSLKERVLIASSHPPIQHLYKQFEQEHEASVLQRIEQAVEETKMRANEERQKILLDANRQMRETLKECNIQSTSKENCWNCGRKATETCSGCNSARYCGTFCQHKDWDKHLKICTRASNATRERGERIIAPVHHTRVVPMTQAAPHNSSHHIPNPHSHITVASGTPRVVKTTRNLPPSSYMGTSEVYVPLRTDPTVPNGSLTTSTNGVAVVTISRSAGDVSGSNIM